MVRFGSFTLPHVVSLQTQSQRLGIDRLVPYRTVGHRRDQANLGRTVKIRGRIDETTIEDFLIRTEQFRRLNDGVSRLLDPQDGVVTAFYAKLMSPEFEFRVEDWHAGRYSAPYSVTFVEVSS